MKPATAIDGCRTPDLVTRDGRAAKYQGWIPAGAAFAGSYFAKIEGQDSTTIHGENGESMDGDTSKDLFVKPK